MNNLGKHGKDKITGFEGTITSEHHYLTGCNQYGLQPKAKEDGTLPDSHYFNINRIEVSGEPIQISGAKDDPGCDSKEHPTE